MSTTSEKTIEALMSEYLTEAVSLRYSLPTIPENADQSVLLSVLQQYRANLDRLEELMVRAFIKKGIYYRRLKELQDAAQDKWDESLSKATEKKGLSLVSQQEFIAPKEKYANANLATLEQRHAVRKAENAYSWTESTSDVLLKMYRGMDSARQDLLARIKAIPMVNSMEYTTS